LAQDTGGIRSLLSLPSVYNFFQSLMGAEGARQKFVEEYVRAKDGDRVLDLGCGTAELLNYLPPVEYRGYDISEKYIAAAQVRFAGRGDFYCRAPNEEELLSLAKFDLVLAVGVLHHLDDQSVLSLMKLAWLALRVGGRLVTLDPCFSSAQNPIARFLISHDRGLNVRTEQQYRLLAENVFGNNVKGEVRNLIRIPYSHNIMVCTVV